MGLPERIREISYIYKSMISYTSYYLEMLFVWKIKYEIQMGGVRGLGGGSNPGGTLARWRLGVSVVNYKFE